jgi:putative alpha-1,2-mannosidase
MIANGGSIVFKMGAQPNMKFGSATGAAPPSMSE